MKVTAKDGREWKLKQEFFLCDKCYTPGHGFAITEKSQKLVVKVCFDCQTKVK